MATVEAPKRKTPFARFFSSVPGHVVGRYGTGTPLDRKGDFRNNAQIGAKLGPEGYEWNDEISAITEQEAYWFKHEYDGHVRRGELKERTEDEYLAFVAALEKRAADYTKAEAAKAKKEQAAEDKG